MATLNAARRPRAAPTEANSQEEPTDLNERYQRGYVTYRELLSQRGELKAESLFARVLRYFLLAYKAPNRTA